MRLHVIHITPTHTWGRLVILLASMYIVKLLMIIAGLNFVESFSTKSEIRFGYGLLYEHRGQLLHGLNKYHLLVGVDIPKIHFYLILLPTGTTFKL